MSKTTSQQNISNTTRSILTEIRPTEIIRKYIETATSNSKNNNNNLFEFLKLKDAFIIKFTGLLLEIEIGNWLDGSPKWMLWIL